MRTADVTGQTFGRLTAQEYLGRSYWRCLCACGRSVRARLNNLRSGNTQSCGCAGRSPRKAAPKTRLLTVRVARGLTQADLARRLSVSAMTVARWESGKAQPSTLQWLALADALGVYPGLIDDERWPP